MVFMDDDRNDVRAVLAELMPRARSRDDFGQFPPHHSAIELGWTSFGDQRDGRHHSGGHQGSAGEPGARPGLTWPDSLATRWPLIVAGHRLTEPEIYKRSDIGLSTAFRSCPEASAVNSRMSPIAKYV